MELPDHLIEDSKKRMEPYDVEGFVLGGGDPNGKIMIVGEAPGEREAVEGIPFIGRAGDELNKQFDYIGVKREDVYITSVVRSRPYQWVNRKDGTKRKANRKPNQQEIQAHAPILDYQIEQMEPDLVIALGGVAFQRLTGRKDKLSSILGKVIETPLLTMANPETGNYTRTEKVYKVFPLYHPAAVFYNPKIKEDIYRSLDQLREIL